MELLWGLAALYETAVLVNVTGCDCISHDINGSRFFRTWVIATME